MQILDDTYCRRDTLTPNSVLWSLLSLLTALTRWSPGGNMRQNSPESKMKKNMHDGKKISLTMDRRVSFPELEYVCVQLRKSPLADVYKSLAMPLLSKTASVTTAPSVLIT